MSNFKSKNIFSENRLLAFLILLLVAFLMHFLALQFIYPGFYRPLDPLHSDHYLAAAFANGPVHYPWLGFLRWARPVFMLFYKCIGYAGIHGSIVCIIALLFVSIAMTATVIRRIFDLPFNLPFVLAYGLYCFMVFSQPFMYCQYTEDVGALLCYFFLVLGVNFFSLTLDKSLWKSFIPLLVCCLLAFLSKETYALAALFFSFLWFIYYRKQSISKAVIPAAAVVLGLIMSSIYNRWVHSVFIDPIASSSQPYYIDMSPSSVINQWLTYAGEGLNIANVLVVLFILFLSFRTNKDKAKSIYTIVGSLAGAGLAWIPNSLLPNHHFPGYVFNGILLLYIPLLLLPFLSIPRRARQWGIVIALILCAASPLLDIPKYHGATDTWILEQEGIERNVLISLDSAISRINPSVNPQKILVKGVTFPFHPFANPESIRVFANARYAHFDVIKYDSSFVTGKRLDLVRFVSMADSSRSDYDQKWTFNGEGKLIMFSSKD